MIKQFRLQILAALAFLLAFGGVALAADAVDPADGTLDIAKSIYNAFSGGHYAYCGALGMILGVALVKRYLGPKVPWLHSDAGGSTLALLGATATALSAGLASGGPVTWGLIKGAGMVGIGAAGGYAMLKNLVIEPLLKPLAAKAPAWAQPIFAMIFWVFDRPDPIATAVKAGDAAVAATPAEGPAAVVGTPTEIK
jgi:hypothetical protein